MAASDKANRRAELMSNAQQAQYNAQLEAQKFQQALTMWNEQKNTSLAQAQQFLINPTDWSAQSNWINKVGELPQVGGFTAVPEFSSTTGGYMKPGYSYQKTPKEDEDPYTKLLQEAGV